MMVADEVQLSEQQFELFQRFLAEKTGLLFDSQRQGLLRSGLAVRMRERGIDSPADYFHLLRFDDGAPAELESLAELVTIGETYFFRNQPHFDILRDHLVPALVARAKASTVRVWSAACSTGEEPYSIAMLLRETLPGPDQWDISILATDINRDHLRRAREAAYNERAVRNVPAAWREKYFTERAGRFHLSDDVKRMVQFEQHNLVGDPCELPAMQAIDFLFCRNVTIYFSLDTTRRVMDRLSRCLDRHGHLFIGDAETLWQISDKFAPVEFSNGFVYRHQPAEPAAIARVPTPVTPAPVSRRKSPVTSSVASKPAPSFRPVPRQETKVAPHAALETEYENAREAMRRKDFTAALELFDAVLRQNSAHQRARLGRASVLADQGESERAIQDLVHVIRSDSLAAEAYYLLGTLNARTGRFDEAVAALQRAIYADPSAALAYFALANVYRQQCRGGKARRELQNALKSLEKKDGQELVSFSEDITCESLRAVCTASLRQLGR